MSIKLKDAVKILEEWIIDLKQSHYENGLSDKYYKSLEVVLPIAKQHTEDLKSQIIETTYPKRREFMLYEQLTKEQKIHLPDFDIINSIENATNQEFRQHEKEVLFDTIKNSWLKDESHTSLSTIADTIVEAYADKKIDLEALSNADSREILNCINGIESFEDLQDEWEDLEQ